MHKKNLEIKSTTIFGLIRDGKAALGCDGQVTLGNTVLKHNAIKIRKLLNGKVLAGFAGSTADALTLLEKFEEKLEKYPSQLTRAAVELAKDWRTDKYLRRLEAMLAVVSLENSFIISGSGDIIEPEDKIVAIGSGAMYAYAAGKMLLKHTTLSAEEITREALNIAGDICIYTNKNITIETIG